MLEYILFVAGLALLLKGADYLVDGSSSLAKRLGISTLVIGLTIVAFGTSMPELVVNILAGIRNADDIALGNILGSNVANILLILGASAIVVKLKIPHSTTWKEIPFALLAIVVLFIFANGKYLDNMPSAALMRSHGIILLAFFSIFIYYVTQMALTSKKQDDGLEIHKYSKFRMALMITGGIAAIYLGGKWTVDGAVYIARQFGISEFIIASTIVAVGTSLPELVTSIVAARKKDSDLSVGNIVGSNIFNIFFILGISALVSPITFHALINIDLAIVFFSTILLFAFIFLGDRYMLSRWQGITFIALYTSYVIFLIIRG